MIPLILGAAARIAGGAAIRGGAASAVEGGAARAAASGVTKAAANPASTASTRGASFMRGLNTASNISAAMPQTNPKSTPTTTSNPGAMTNISES
jgi:hypothetical protein